MGIGVVDGGCILLGGWFVGDGVVFDAIWVGDGVVIGEVVGDDVVESGFGGGVVGDDGGLGSSGVVKSDDFVVLSAVEFPNHVPRKGVDWVARLTYPNDWTVVEYDFSILSDLSITDVNLAFGCLRRDLPVKVGVGSIDKLDGDINPAIGRLKEFVREHAPGQCKMYSIGDDCGCGLCDLDEVQFVLSECLVIINDCILRGMPVDERVARVSNFIRGVSEKYDGVCVTCGVGFRLPSGNCDHCDRPFV